MTPFELNLCASATAEKLKNDQESELFYSYVNAYWQRVETLKSFEDMIGKERKAKAMSPEEMLAKVMGIHAEMGGITQEGG